MFLFTRNIRKRIGSIICYREQMGIWEDETNLQNNEIDKRIL